MRMQARLVGLFDPARSRAEVDMTMPECTVYVVDDDPGVRESMEDLLSAYGFNVFTFSSAAE